MFEVYDKQTGKTVASAKTREGARRAVDTRDNNYGGYRYGYRAAGSNRSEY